MSKSCWKGFYVNNKLWSYCVFDTFQTENMNIKTNIHLFNSGIRSTTIFPMMSGVEFNIYNGRKLKPIVVRRNMFGLKLGSLVSTKDICVFKKRQSRKKGKLLKKLKKKKPNVLFSKSHSQRKFRRNKKNKNTKLLHSRTNISSVGRTINKTHTVSIETNKKRIKKLVKKKKLFNKYFFLKQISTHLSLTSRNYIWLFSGSTIVKGSTINSYYDPFFLIRPHLISYLRFLNKPCPSNTINSSNVRTLD